MAKIVKTNDTWGDFIKGELFILYDRNSYRGNMYLFNRRLGHVISICPHKFYDVNVDSRTCKRLTKQAKRARIPLSRPV